MDGSPGGTWAGLAQSSRSYWHWGATATFLRWPPVRNDAQKPAITA